MFIAEYIRNCNCNYERIPLDEKPEEKRYQYCILSRGGIRYLLSCSLRFIDNKTYLYYDISSTQNMKQIFFEKKIDREWIKDFLWGIKQMHCELDRFLLDDNNIVWDPEHIFQDLERNDFFFLYIPYYAGEDRLGTLSDFLIEHLNYEDEELVEFVYATCEKLQQVGISYLYKQIHEDFQHLNEYSKKKAEVVKMSELTMKEEIVAKEEPEELWEKEQEKKSFRFLWEGRKKKQVKREEYRESLRQSINGTPAYVVCEESSYNNAQEDKGFGEEFGRTIYVEAKDEPKEVGLYKPDGELVVELVKLPFVIGKKKENADLVLNDYSVSRVHARIIQEEGGYFIEDLNSTNGTFKNGLRLKPYEKRKLEREDELRFGKSEYIYR